MKADTMQLFQFSVIIICVTHAKGYDVNNTAPSDINAQYLIDVGVKTNDAKLEAVGIAMKNLHQQTCGDWSTWSKCTSNMFRYFGMKQRTRKCVSASLGNETDLRLCRNRCPSDYKTTANRFCLKLHTSAKLHSEAENYCKSEGGHLVHINSQAKYDAIVKMNFPNNLAKYIHIGGQRKDVTSNWKFNDGTRMTFFRWAPNEPDAYSHELCLLLETKPMTMHNGECRQKFPCICEITA
ncbi:C-type lectin lectoxin-Lio2-like [Ruditapes philippinarum]|uniref:C-type lectin lectoxin-Lio2-like n=1 Tax=Ruditapes philippinarum TaxID=129788 RepID=UPI00295BA505|nr:C-type lectin lectoxin-Lio2-like [Ruditapes philippinarum]